MLVGNASYGLATLIIDDVEASNSGKYVCIADPAGLHLFNYTILAYVVDVGEHILLTVIVSSHDVQLSLYRGTVLTVCLTER
jgi:hypothetical protein